MKTDFLTSIRLALTGAMILSFAGPTAAEEVAPPKPDKLALSSESLFIITPGAIEFWKTNKDNAVLPAVADKLKPLSGLVFQGTNSFMKSVTEKLGDENAAKFRGIILSNTIGHPHPQPRPAMGKMTQTSDTTTIETSESIFEPPQDVDGNSYQSGSNLLPNVYSDIYDGTGLPIPNTLPSRPTNPYNLHDGPPVVTIITPTSPSDDLRRKFTEMTNTLATMENDPWPWRTNLQQYALADPEAPDRLKTVIEGVIDILEGNPIPDRAYSGFPLLHYNGPLKSQKVEPILDAAGKVIGGNVNIRQVWYDSHIESDTCLINTTNVEDVPWTVTYTVDVLNRGADDFSPFVMYTANAALSPMPMPNIGMDQSFFPMENGTRTILKIKMAPAKYFSLTYTWGWRVHPPRAQVFENQNKPASVNGKKKSLLEWEQDVFGVNPRKDKEAKLKAIGMIGDLAPEKRMWNAMQNANRLVAEVKTAATNVSKIDMRTNEILFRTALNDFKEKLHDVTKQVTNCQAAFVDWTDRTRLPEPLRHLVDTNTDMTLLYVNNTIYCGMPSMKNDLAAGSKLTFPEWKKRGAKLKVTLINGDYFEHAYQNVDFGGARGWENQFKSSVKLGGSGCWFTFGRTHFWMNVPPKPTGDLGVVLPPAKRATVTGESDQLTRHQVDITFNYEPSTRLRFYQFDPLHHDVAIMSIH